MLWEADRRLTRTQAASQTSINFARSIAADGAGRVHLAWREGQDENSEIYYKRSPDGGVSWGPSIRLTNALGRSENPSIAVSGNTVVVGWWDERTGAHQIWSKRSIDGGITWQPDVQITFSPGGGAFCSLAVWGNTWHIVYVDGRDGHEEVYYTRSLDNAATWSGPARLSALPDSSYTPTVAVWQSNVYVAWTDTRHGGSQSSLEEEYFRRSTDGGTSFEPEQRLTTDPPESPANSWAPSLVARDQYVWFTWFDARDGNFEIYTKRSTDGGVTWSSDTRLTNTTGQSLRPSIALQGQQLFISYWDTDGGNEEIYALRSDDLGGTWSFPERLTFDNGSSTYPICVAASTGVHIAWTDSRDGNSEIYYKRLPGKAVRAGNGHIAFTRGIVNGEQQIYTVGADGTNETQLTFEGTNQYPSWSKDGTKIAFSSNRSGAFEIWTMNPDGSDQQRITYGAPGGSFVPDWSYDGTRIAYAFDDPGVGHPEVWVMNADGTDQTRLTITPPSGGQFTWSLHPTWEPGDERIYYASTAGGTSQVWGMFSNGMGQEQKTNGLGSDYPHANAPEFSRDGTLTFWAGIEGQYGEVWTVRIGGSPTGPTRLTETPDPMNSDNPSWAPDGTKLLFDSNQPSPNGGTNIWAISSTGTNLELLIPGGIGLFSWQPVFNAAANISGRVTAQNGRGVAAAVVTATDDLGNMRYAMTNPFGYYRFLGLPTGEDYLISVRSKRYHFTPRTINVWGDLTSVDFTAEP
jgi:Tol biopolymer transport system component